MNQCQTLNPIARCLAAGVFALASQLTLAATPAQIKAQVPGYQRLAIGEYEVTALFDGYNDLGPGLLKGLSQQDIRSLLARKYIFSPGVQTAFNAFLVNTGQHLVLVDSGAGACIGETAGGLADNLRAAGYRPEQVDTVLITHLHLDHVCGLVTAQGQALFSQAQVYVAQAEADYWLSAEQLNNASAEARGYFEVAQKSVAPYLAAGRLKTFRPGQSPIEEVTIVNEAGHTPGSSGYRFTSNGQSILFVGDIIHSFAVQFQHPEVSIGFDVDSDQAVAVRQRIFSEVAQDHSWVAAAHLPFPGIGHIAAGTKTFTWVPLQYGPYQRATHVPLIE